MADISMCKGFDCPKRDECYRHTAPQSKHWQAWFVTTPLISADPFECEYHIPTAAMRQENEREE